MEKLELKYIAPHLPYGVKVGIKDKEEGFCQWTIKEKKGLLFLEGDNDGKGTSDKGITFLYTEKLKMILWKLEDLTEEMAKECTYISKDDMIRSIRSGHVPYKIWIDLISNDWDVFDLIPKNLAIDVNTLKK